MPVRTLYYCYCSLLLLLSITAPVRAAPMELGKDLPFSLFTDASGKMGLEQVAALPPLVFEHPLHSVGQALPPGSHWLRLFLSPEQMAGGDAWFEIVPADLDHMTLYMRSDPSKPWRIQRYGPFVPATARAESYRPAIFALRALPGDGLELLVHLQTPTEMQLDASVSTADDFATQALRGTMLWGLYFGVALMSTLLALALSLVLRSRTLLAIAAYGFTHVFSGFQGVIGWGLFPGISPINGTMMMATMILTEVAMLWLAREALNIREHFPRVDRAILGLMAVLVLSLLLLPFWRTFPLLMVVYVMAGLAKCLLAILGFVLWYHHGWKYGLMTLAYAFLILSSVASFSSSFGLIPYGLLNFLVWQYVTISLILMICCLLVHGVLRHRQDMLAATSLRTQLDIERESSFRQRQFVGMVSHEFRTPLSVITAAARNLQRRIGLDESPRDEDTRLRLSRILRATNRLVQLTDNCLADARLDRQLDTLEIRSIDLLSILRESAELVELSDRHQLRLMVGNRLIGEAGTDAILPVCPIQGDAALLRIAFSNVLDNAVKYSTSGAITAVIEDQQQWWRIAIKNKGQGIPDDMAEAVFQPYVTGCSKKSPTSGSTGLGLSVAEKIARAHQGVLKLESGTPDRTVFAFYFCADYEQDTCH